MFSVKISDCLELFHQGYTLDGPYIIYPQGINSGILVYCEMSDGGQTRIQRRENGIINFNENWATSRQGYGNISAEHWLGMC